MGESLAILAPPGVEVPVEPPARNTGPLRTNWSVPFAYTWELSGFSGADISVGVPGTLAEE